ncbi:MAG: hypothetical protein ACJ8G1_04225 [Vitreoscilla sp.]
MTGALPPFHAALALDPSTPPDERALRRAYARRLKQIDIEAEPERFQALREALDQGLRWVAWRDQQGPVQAPAPAPAHAPEPLPALAPRQAPRLARPAETDVGEPPRPVDAPRARPEGGTDDAPAAEARAPGPDDLAAVVLARLKRRIEDGLADSEAARSVLLGFLGDPGLVSLDARAAFEAAIARLLASHWQPGHEHLLDPAIEVFGWNSDHARLKHFGQAGLLLTAAIRDRAIVHAFDPAQRAALATLLARLRSQAAPDPGLLADEVAQLQFLVERVSNWLRVVSPVGPVNERLEMWSRRPVPPPAPAGPQPRFTRRTPASACGVGGLVLAGVLLLAIGRELAVDPHAKASREARRPGGPSLPADEAALARRQKEADALLARIRLPEGAPR